MPHESEFASIEQFGLSESEPLQTSSGQKLFGWGLGLLSLAIVVGVGAVVDWLHNRHQLGLSVFQLGVLTEALAMTATGRSPT